MSGEKNIPGAGTRARVLRQEKQSVCSKNGEASGPGVG